MDARPTKPELRVAALSRRDALSPAERAARSARIAARTVDVLAALRPRTVGTYRAYGSEADTAAIVTACAANDMTVALPRMVDGKRMEFLRHRVGDRLEPDTMGILAPAATADRVDPDVLIVPVSAFDRTGTRLGKGRGVYDRTLAASRARGHDPTLVGIAFSVQEVPAIPAELHDVRLDWIVTESETIRLRRTS